MRFTRCSVSAAAVVSVLLPLFFVACRGGPSDPAAPGPEGAPEEPDRESSAYEPDRRGMPENPRLTSRDREIREAVREIYRNEVAARNGEERSGTHYFDKVNFRGRIVEYLSGLAPEQTGEKVAYTGRDLFGAVRGDEHPPVETVGNWFRVRGLPVTGAVEITTPEELPRHHTLYRVILENPSATDDPETGFFVQAFFLEEPPRELTGVRIVEVNGVLWDHWEIDGENRSGPVGNSNQSHVPILLVSDFTVVEEE